MKREDEFKTVITLNDAISAQMVAGMLNENGIPAAVFGADSTAMLNGVGNIDVKVNASDYEAAMELINTPSEDIEDDEYFDTLRETYAASPIILFPESISKNDYNWKRDLEPVTLEFAKNITISGNTYEMWYEPHNAIGENFGRVEGYVSTNSVGIDATIKFENK